MYKSICIAGLVDLVIRTFPPFPIPGFVPNFTGYNFDKNVNWNEMYKFMAPATNITVMWVSFTVNPLKCSNIMWLKVVNPYMPKFDFSCHDADTSSSWGSNKQV